MTAKKITVSDIWNNLSKIDVNEHTDKKGNLTYLSWAWAWGVLMQHYPNSEYTFKEPVELDNGTVEIWVTLTIEGFSREMWLPVMDYKNKSILRPTTRDISDTRMRCLVKCMAMFGLGCYIYAGEDLPEATKTEILESVNEPIPDRIEKCASVNSLVALWKTLSEKERADNEKTFSNAKAKFMEVAA